MTASLSTPTRSPIPRASAGSPFDAPVRDFLAYLRVEAGLATATLQAYQGDLRDLTVFLRVAGVHDPASVTPHHLSDHVRYLSRERAMESTSIARHLATLRVFFRFLYANRRLPEDPTRLLETPHRWKRLPGVLTPRQMQALLEISTPETGRLWLRDKAMIELMYAAGLRASEVGALRLTDFNRTLSVVLVTGKGSKQRLVPIGKPARECTETYLRELRPTQAAISAMRAACCFRTRGGRWNGSPSGRSSADWRTVPASPRPIRTCCGTASPPTC